MSLLQDLRFAVRLLVKDRWFTAVAVVALALGIGVNSTVFTFVNAVLIRGLPFDEPDRIMALGTRDARNRDRMHARTSISRTGAPAPAPSPAWPPSAAQTMNVSDEGRAPERFGGPYISANAFTLIGERPIIGRDFRPEDDRPGARAGGAPRQRHLEEPLRQRPRLSSAARSRSTSCRRRSSA